MPGFDVLVLWLFVPTINFLAMYNYWAVSKGNLKTSYPLSMAMHSLAFVVECTLAYRDMTQAVVLLYNLANIWGFIMAYRGYKRLSCDLPR